MKILITGGCGFVGSNLCLSLKKSKHKVFSLDNLTGKSSLLNSKLLKEKQIKNYKFDIFNSNKLNNLPKFDLIIDCCAEAAVEISKKELDRVINTNLIGTFNILKKIKRDKSKIIFISSSRVYSIQKINDLIKYKDSLKTLKIKKKLMKTLIP